MLPLLPILGAATGSYGAYKLIQSAFCSVSDAIAAHAVCKMSLSALTKQINSAGNKVDEGIISRGHLFINRMNSIDEFKIKNIDNADFLTSGKQWHSTEACQLIKMVVDLHNDMATLSNVVASKTGTSPVVPPPPGGSGGFPWFWAGVAVVGGYFIFKHVVHGDIIPKKYLPRYAGGTRGRK